MMVGHVDPKSQHIAGDYPELFGQLLENRGLELVRYDLDSGHFPSDTRECDGWICSPSRMSTYDNVPWLADVEALLRSFIEKETPYVGICFGHQLLAQALGGRVAKADYGWGVGVKTYDVVAPQSWMAPSVERISLIASHQDQVVEMPSGATPIFTADYCPNGGFAVGERAWTLQIHPEFVPDLADHLLAGRIELIGAERVAAARATLTQTLSRSILADWIAAFFHQSTKGQP